MIIGQPFPILFKGGRMLILLGLIIGIVLGSLLLKDKHEAAKIVGFFATAISSIALLSFIVAMPIERIETQAFIEEIKIVRNSPGYLVSNYKRINFNCKIARAKYYRKTIVKLWTHPDIEDLKYLELR